MVKSGPFSGRYEFDGFVLDPLGRSVRTRGDNQKVRLTARAFDALHLLVEHHGQLVDKETLIKALWPRVVVEENNLNQVIHALRQALGEKPGEHRFIATAPGRGYQFVAHVTEVGSEAPASRPWRWAAAALVLLLLGTAWWMVGRNAHNDSAAKTPATAAHSSVAVLPFVNLTGDATKDYLGEGMAEELIDSLTRVPGLKVPARTSSFAYKGRNTDIRQIAKDLAVSAIVEGSVRGEGKALRITAQLIDGADGTHLWSQTYDRQLTDLLKLQDELAATIERALQVKLVGGGAATAARAPPTQDVESYQLVLQGFALLDRPTRDNVVLAESLFQQAVARDPGYARAYVGLGTAHLRAMGFGSSWRAGNDAAEAAARKALALDPNSAKAESILGELAFVRYDMLAAEAHQRRAAELDPSDAVIKYQHAKLLAYMGQMHEAQRLMLEAYALAPANPQVVGFTALVLSWAGDRDEEAAKYANLASELGFPVGLVAIVSEFPTLRTRRYDQYAAALKLRYPDGPDLNSALELTRRVFAAMNDPAQLAEALAARRQLYGKHVKFTGRSQSDLCASNATSLAYLGAIDDAFAMANQCLDNKPEPELLGGEICPWAIQLRAFRQDPRFQAYIDRRGAMAYYKEYGPPDECEISNGRLICR